MQLRWAPLFIVAAGSVFGQSLTPREIFYGQRRAPEAKPAAAASTPTATPKKVMPVRTPKVGSTPAAAAAAAAGVETPVASVAPAAGSTLKDGAQVIPVKLTNVGATPLALRYSVKKLDSNGNTVEVDPDSVFHEGDQITLAIEANDAGFLYVVHQGSSGRWDVKYPGSKVAGSNHVERGSSYRVPTASDEVFAFDSTAGTERLFVVLSRKPMKDLDDLIFSLQDSQPKPVKEEVPASRSGQTLMIAKNIDNSMVAQMRQVYSRDLVIQKVTAPEPSASQGVPAERVGEKAVYVVNAKAGPDARVVADIQLKHQ